MAIHSVQSHLCTYPQMLAAIFINAPDLIVTNAGWVIEIVFENIESTVFPQTAQAALHRTHPHCTLTIYKKCADMIIGKAAGNIGVVLEYTDVFTVISVQSIGCSKPYKTVLIFNNALDDI